MNYCIIRSGNKQYQVSEGSLIQVELLPTTAGEVVFDDVLLVVDGDNVTVGTPTVPDFKVYGSIQGSVKADKIQVFKYKSKSRYRKLRGHRQNYTSVKIVSLGTKAAPAKPAAKKPAVKKTATKKATAKKA